MHVIAIFCPGSFTPVSSTSRLVQFRLLAQVFVQLQLCMFTKSPIIIIFKGGALSGRASGDSRLLQRCPKFRVFIRLATTHAQAAEAFHVQDSVPHY